MLKNYLVRYVVERKEGVLFSFGYRWVIAENELEVKENFIQEIPKIKFNAEERRKSSGLQNSSLEVKISSIELISGFPEVKA